MAYDYPTEIDTTSLLGALVYLNTVTRGWFANMILISLYSIALYGYYKATHNIGEGMAVVGFFVFVVALFFWVGEWLSVFTFVIAIAVAIIGVLAFLVGRDQY